MNYLLYGASVSAWAPRVALLPTHSWSCTLRYKPQTQPICRLSPAGVKEKNLYISLENRVKGKLNPLISLSYP